MARLAWAILLGVGVFALSSGAATAGDPPRPGGAGDVQSVSMIQLIASPSVYEGQRVAVTGFCNIEFEGSAVFLHEEDFRHGLRINAVQLELPDPVPAAFRKAQRRYAMLEGVFAAPRVGAPGYRGRLHSITRVEPIPGWAERTSAK